MSKVFNEEDFNSGNGMITTVWGPPLWFSLHTMSFNYPVNPTKEQKQQYYAYFTSLQWTLSCKYCRENYKNNLKVLPLNKEALKNRENLSRWLYNLHNMVNRNLGKENYKTYEEIRELYENFRARCTVNYKREETKEEDKIEKGCTEPLYGVKPKGVVAVMPYDRIIKNNESIIVSEEVIKSKDKKL